MKLGFLGCGKMGSALIRGVLDAGVCQADEVILYDRFAASLEVLAKEYGLRTASSNREAVEGAEVVILCVKPGDVKAALAEAGGALEGRLLISIAAGVSIAALQCVVGSSCRVARVMPNTAVLVRQGAAAYAMGEGATDEDAARVEKIFSSVGLVARVEEPLLDAVTGLSGSGPAYVYLFIEALADGGVRAGLPRDLAIRLAVKTVAGAAEMVAQTQLHPAVLRDMVTSPGGTTLAGLAELEHAGLRAAVMDAVCAATERSRELGGGGR